MFSEKFGDKKNIINKCLEENELVFHVNPFENSHPMLYKGGHPTVNNYKAFLESIRTKHGVEVTELFPTDGVDFSFSVKPKPEMQMAHDEILIKSIGDLATEHRLNIRTPWQKDVMDVSC